MRRSETGGKGKVKKSRGSRERERERTRIDFKGDTSPLPPTSVRGEKSYRCGDTGGRHTPLLPPDADGAE